MSTNDDKKLVLERAVLRDLPVFGHMVTIVTKDSTAVDWARQCEKLQVGVRARMAAVRRKKSWSASTKAMTLGEFQQQDDALTQMRAAIIESFGRK